MFILDIEDESAKHVGKRPFSSCHSRKFPVKQNEHLINYVKVDYDYHVEVLGQWSGKQGIYGSMGFVTWF